MDHGDIDGPSQLRRMDKLIREIDWPSYQLASGPADGFGDDLLALLDSRDFSDADTAWRLMEDRVFSQGTIYTAAEPTTIVLLNALQSHQPRWRSGRITDLLFFILNGVSSSHPLLQTRCRDLARSEIGVLKEWVSSHRGWERENMRQVIELVDPADASER